jgi:3-deoxy-D-manno-octulosonic-acid transferase
MGVQRYLLRQLLRRFTHIFTQNRASRDFLRRFTAQANISMSGDPRFDRVYTIVEQAAPMPEIEQFKGRQFCLVAGSTWPPDDQLLWAAYTQLRHEQWKLILAPHELGRARLARLKNVYPAETLFYSELEQYNPNEHRILILDNIGMLARLYAYGDICYVGGGFGPGLHNTLEPAAHGRMVTFGPQHRRFQEAIDLREMQAARVVRNSGELVMLIEEGLHAPGRIHSAGERARNYIRSHRGAAQHVLAFVEAGGYFQPALSAEDEQLSLNTP